MRGQEIRYRIVRAGTGESLHPTTFAFMSTAELFALRYLGLEPATYEVVPDRPRTTLVQHIREMIERDPLRYANEHKLGRVAEEVRKENDCTEPMHNHPDGCPLCDSSPWAEA